MSLITRCPACETLFKVVPDQLRISEGWVRCGQCDEVFDAAHHLVSQPPSTPEPEVTPDAPVMAPPPMPVVPVVPDFAPEPMPEVEPEPVPEFESSPETDAVPEPSPESTPEAPLYFSHFLEVDLNLDEERTDQNAATLPAPDTQEATAAAPPERESDALADDGDSLAAPGLGDADVHISDTKEAVEAGVDVPSDTRSGLDEVSFLRDKPPEVPVSHPWSRALWSLMVFVLIFAFMAQWLYRERDQLVAHEPQFKPLILALCEPLNCALSPWRNIDAMVIESSSFAKLRTDAYQLSFSLKNTAGVDVARPAIELTLTDALDRAIVRRVLSVDQLGAESALLAAGQEWVVSVPLGVDVSASPERIAGYRLLAFYP